ncbi:hypothetical protein ACHWQZ_G005698 [Mnemiopsis leidyi]
MGLVTTMPRMFNARTSWLHVFVAMNYIGCVFLDTAPYKFPIKKGSLQRGVQIGIMGLFSGEYLAIARASLRTSNDDTIFRIALRFNGTMEKETYGYKEIVFSTTYNGLWEDIGDRYTMANYSEGPISITIRIEDTFVVEISNGESTWNLMTEIKTTNCSDVVELYLQRMYEDLAGSFKWADSFQWLKAVTMESRPEPGNSSLLFLSLITSLFSCTFSSYSHKLEYCQNFVELKRLGVDSNTECPGVNRICCAHWVRETATHKAYNNSLVHKISVQSYCCNNDKTCCSGTCCEKEEFCCKPYALSHTSSPVCCPSSAHCCHNSRGEIVCCPELVKQIWIIIALILVVYTVTKFSRAIRTYCNIVPFEDDNICVLDESEVKRMRYCFFGLSTSAIKKGKVQDILSL